MKKIDCFMAVSTLILLGGCSGNKTTTGNGSGSSSQLTEYTWYLAELKGKPYVTNAESHAHLVFTQGQPNKLSGSTGCNRLTGTYELPGVNGIKFSPLATTRMACPDNTEFAFTEALRTVDNWSVTNGRLLLSSGKIPVAKFNAVSADAENLSGTWDLNYISGPRIAFDGLFPDKKPFMSFNFSGMTASGNTSCNNFSSPFTVSGSSIKFGNAVKTLMACTGGGEDTFLKMLGTVDRFDVTSDQALTFFAKEIPVMKFAKRK